MKSTEFLTEIRGMSLADIKEKQRLLFEELMKLRFRKAAGQLDQSHRIKEVRQSIARVATVLGEKTAAQA
jgi:large subunit ribosomal protein L29